MSADYSIRNNHYDDVRGEVFGPISHPYRAIFKMVQVWPKHGERKEYPPREHCWWSHRITRAQAIADYIKENRRESNLGDGTPCITTLEVV